MILPSRISSIHIFSLPYQEGSPPSSSKRGKHDVEDKNSTETATAPTTTCSGSGSYQEPDPGGVMKHGDTSLLVTMSSKFYATGLCSTVRQTQGVHFKSQFLNVSEFGRWLVDFLACVFYINAFVFTIY